jgi:hypothetical protein
MFVSAANLALVNVEQLLIVEMIDAVSIPA